MIDLDFWYGRKVFLTGHTGFKGSWLSLWLASLGARVTGYALEPPTDPAMFYIAGVQSTLDKSLLGDVRDEHGLASAMQMVEPEIVIHMAAQSLVQESYADPVETYSTNIMGTVNVLEAVRNTPSVVAVLNVTSDKCYENREQQKSFGENSPMGGHDPYSSSKGCAELVSSAYRRSFLRERNVGLATARAGNVLGGGDWAKDRIIPDAIRAFVRDEPFLVRNPLAVRPWQHVLEPLAGYLVLCQKLYSNPISFDGGWNFGPGADNERPVSTLADTLVMKWSNGVIWRAKDLKRPHEASQLGLDSSKARALLDWRSVWDLERVLTETVNWYQRWHTQGDMHQFTLKQINNYQCEKLGE